MGRIAAVGATVAALLTPHDAPGHYKPGTHNVRHAVNLAWCGRSNSYCGESWAAWRVAGCETGYTYSVWARNGQYANLFQMGYTERRTYGWHIAGSDPWKAARSAHRYYVASGRDWSPWECKP